MTCLHCHQDRPLITTYPITGEDRHPETGQLQPQGLCRPCATIDSAFCPVCVTRYRYSPQDHPGWWAAGRASLMVCPDCSTSKTDPHAKCGICGYSRSISTVTAKGTLVCSECSLDTQRCSQAGCPSIIHHAEDNPTAVRGVPVCSVECSVFIRGFNKHPTKWPYIQGCPCNACRALAQAGKEALWPEEPLNVDSVCSGCGDNCWTETSIIDGLHTYCHHCAVVNYTKCEDCEVVIPKRDLPLVTGLPGQIERLSVCHDCIETRGTHWFCDVRCNRWFTNGTICNCDGVYPWNYTPDIFNFLSATQETVAHSTTLYMGLELEVEAVGESASRRQGASLLREIAGDWAYPVHDGTLANRGAGGFEIVTHPFTYRWFTEHWDDFDHLLTTLASKGYRSWEGKRCGMHIHVSRRPMSESHQMRFIRFIYNSIPLCTCIGQRSNSDPYLQRYAPFDKEKRDRFIEKVRNYVNPGVEGHYAALNADKRHTLEARWFRGTLNPLSFRKNIEFIHSLWHFTKREGHRSSNEVNYVAWLGETPQKRDYAVLRDYIHTNYLTRK